MNIHGADLEIKGKKNANQLPGVDDFYDAGIGGRELRSGRNVIF